MIIGCSRLLRSKRIQFHWVGAAVLSVPLVFMAVFYVYPVVTLVGISLTQQGNVSLSSFGEILTSAYYLETLLFTVQQAALSTLLTIGLALPGAYIFARYRFYGKSVLLALVTLPFVLPTVVVAAAFDALLGEHGVINDLLSGLSFLGQTPLQLEHSLGLILIAHVFYNYSVALRLISSYWANQNRRMEEAAQVLGCAGWRLWWEIRLPLLMPALSAAAVLVFIFSFTSFGVVLLLGGVRLATIEVEIYRQTVNMFGGLPLAGALSVLQIGFMGVLMLVYTRLQTKTSAGLHSAVSTARPPQTRGEYAWIILNLLVIGGMILTPLLALVARSLSAAAEMPPWRYYTALLENPRGSVLFVPPSAALMNSVVFAVLTTLLAVILGTLAAYALKEQRRRWFDVLLMLPLATSAVTLGFGFILALDEPPLNLRTSPWLLPIAHTLVALPFVVRGVLPALHSIPPELHQAAQTLGAPPWRKWLSIDLPLISRGVAVGAAFAFTVSMGEFGASLFIARPDTPTIPVVIYRLLGQPGAIHYGQAMAMSVLLMSVCASAFLLIERLRKTQTGLF